MIGAEHGNFEAECRMRAAKQRERDQYLGIDRDAQMRLGEVWCHDVNEQLARECVHGLDCTCYGCESHKRRSGV